MATKTKSSPAGLIFLYVVAALTIASYGYGIGGTNALGAGAIYAFAGLVLAYICVGFAPRFLVVVAFATGMLGSILRASSVPDINLFIPKVSTLNYLRAILTVCGAIGFGAGLYGGFRFTGSGLFNWGSRALLSRVRADQAKSRRGLTEQLASEFYASERMYFSVLAAVCSALITWVEVRPVAHAMAILVVAVLVIANLSWSLGEWLRPRLKVLSGVFRVLQQMWEALIAFLLGYAAIIFVFACFYTAAWQHNHVAFTGMEPVRYPGFGNFLYFSVVTMATLGYGDVIPSDAVSRTLACVEVVIGVGWVTVVLSAAAALARPKVDMMLREVWEEEGELPPPEPRETPGKAGSA